MKLLVWDFDGTLAYRDRGWSGTFSEVLADHAPDFRVTREELSSALQEGFPWHTPDLSHEHICGADEWWAWMQPVFKRAFVKIGVDPILANQLAGRVRHRFCSIDSWSLYPDTLSSLRRASAQGWKSIVLSNHVPELPQIVEALGLQGFFIRITNSADTGFEKPNPKAYESAVEGIDGIEDIWMIGDSLSADFEGPRKAGWKSILVRQRATVSPAFDTLEEVVTFLNQQPGKSMKTVP